MVQAVENYGCGFAVYIGAPYISSFKQPYVDLRAQIFTEIIKLIYYSLCSYKCETILPNMPVAVYHTSPKVRVVMYMCGASIFRLIRNYTKFRKHISESFGYNRYSCSWSLREALGGNFLRKIRYFVFAFKKRFECFNLVLVRSSKLKNYVWRRYVQNRAIRHEKAEPISGFWRNRVKSAFVDIFRFTIAYERGVFYYAYHYREFTLFFAEIFCVSDVIFCDNKPVKREFSAINYTGYSGVADAVLNCQVFIFNSVVVVPYHVFSLQFRELASRLAAFGHLYGLHSGKIYTPILALA